MKKTIGGIKYRCRGCGTMLCPLPLDGSPKTCLICGQMVLAPDNQKTKAARAQRGES